MKPPSDASGDTRAGFLMALGAYLLWGVLPIYLHALRGVPPAEVVVWRVFGSVPVVLAVLWVLGRTADLRAALGNPRMLAQGMLAAALLSVNWGIYIWAVQVGQTVEAALGYFINPLFTILLGRFLLGERLAPLQWAAVGLAALAVAVLTWEAGRLPWLALSLTVSWGFYAYCKRALPIGPSQGFALEVIVLTPVALAWVAWQGAQGVLVGFGGGAGQTALLLIAGPVTAIPLLLYANGAKGLRLSTIGLMQYLTPTLVFLVAVLVLGEPFEGARLVAFPLIWAALVLYSWSFLRARRGTGQTR